MNFSFIKKKIFNFPDDTCEGPFKIIKSNNFLYSDGECDIKCINMKTNKTNFVLENEYLAEPFFGLVNELKLIVKPNESKVSLYQINEDLSECKKIKDLKIKGFQIARSLSNEGYIIGCEEKILVYNSQNELESSFGTKFNFFGFDFHVTPPFEIQLKSEKNNLLVFPMDSNKTNIYLRNSFKNVMNVHSKINDALDMEDGNIILACEEKLCLVRSNTYKVEYEVECPQIEEDLIYYYPHEFHDIFVFKDNIFVTISGLSNHTDNRFLVSFWNYNFSKKDKLENIQCLKFDEYYQMIDKENLLIMDDDNSIIQLSFKKIKGKAKNIVETTTVSEFNKKRKKKKIK